MDVAVEGRLEPQIETVLYRVAQEALANVAKHARAGGARVSLRTEDGSVILKLADDGAGFDPEDLPALVAAGHFGLAAMRQRIEMAGGAWRLRTAPGAGTAIEVSFAVPETVAA